MCSSHVLLVQSNLKKLLTPRAMEKMRALIEKDEDSGPTDIDMVNALENLTKNFMSPTSDTSSKRRPKSGRDKTNLEDEELATPDWIEIAGAEMHSAKLAATRLTIKGWFSKSSDCKVVIFTQFLGMVRLLEFMCEAEMWGLAMVSPLDS